MDTIECIKTRRSVRKFLDKPVSWDDICTIIDAGRMAPSAGNLQSWKFIVVEDKDPKEQIAKACVDQLWIKDAPYIIVIVSEPEKMKRFYDVRGERLYSVQSCAAAAQNMLLAAHNLGLGSCWIGAFDEEKVKTILGCPAETRPQVIIPVGYPAETVEKPNKYPMEIVTYRRYWRGRIYDVDKALGMYSPKVEKVIGKTVETIKKAPEHVKKAAAHIKKKVSEAKAKRKAKKKA
ncbi:nitroreductase family protein [Candidatus Woesearchaeota archaeon]|nr:nitroreductase family protein [Candidatus Woesearchaeota archaeon]